MAYYWLDYAQRLIAELGFTRVHDGPVRIVPYNPEVVDNAFYSPAEETIHMGVASSGISESEDAMTLLHEYGHALLDAQVPGLFTEEGAAYHEAFGDLFGFLVSLELRYVDPPCWGQLWYYFGEPCFRRLDVMPSTPTTSSTSLTPTRSPRSGPSTRSSPRCWTPTAWPSRTAPAPTRATPCATASSAPS